MKAEKTQIEKLTAAKTKAEKSIYLKKNGVDIAKTEGETEIEYSPEKGSERIDVAGERDGFGTLRLLT